jgi:heptosyltransferase-3
VVTLRYLGDTLLITPLLNSLKQAYPDAEIDVLLYENTAGMLEGNSAIANLITTGAKPDWQARSKLFKRIFRRYDLAINTQTGDKPTLYTFLASSVRIGFVPPKPQTGWFKRYLYTRWLEFDVQKTHTVLELLRLCQLLAIPPVYYLTAPKSNFPGFQNLEGLTQNYAVLHVMPQWRYKQWTREGWITLAHYLKAQGVQVVLSGSGNAKELTDLTDISTEFPEDTLNLAGKLSLAELAHLIKQARLFIGVDTGITHLAAATGVPTIALFGPSDPVKWTPWPIDYVSEKPPFVTKGSQHVNNIYLIQGQQDCVPCYLEGCERHQQSYSACLDGISPEQVQSVVADILERKCNTSCN